MQVLPIGFTSVIWANLVALNYGQTLRETEAEGLSAYRSLPKFLLRETSSGLDLRYETEALDFFTVQFAIKLSEGEQVNIPVVTALRGDSGIVYVTGTLNEWRRAVLRGLRAIDYHTRIACGLIYLHFESAELGILWLDYCKVGNRDGTFFLQCK